MSRPSLAAYALALLLGVSTLGVVATPAAGRVLGETLDGSPVGRIVVRWHDGAGMAGRSSRLAAAQPGLRMAAAVDPAAEAYELPAPLAGPALATALERIAASPGVASVGADRRVFPALAPNDPYFPLQWDLGGGYGVDAAAAWDTTLGDPSIVVAVIDTGIVTHPDLAGRTVAGYDFISDALVANDGDGRDADPADPGDWITAAESANGYFKGCPVTNSSWHGSHVAGTIVATANNATGIAGIAPGARVAPIRVLGKCGGYLSDVAAAIRWAAGGTVPGVPSNPTPARIANLSLSGPAACDPTMQDAVTYATNAGTLVVAAAGNSAIDASNAVPANCAGALAVASTTSAGLRSSFSNYGATVAIAAPGSGIYSTVDSGTRSPAGAAIAAYSGTLHGGAARRRGGRPRAVGEPRARRGRPPLAAPGQRHRLRRRRCGARMPAGRLRLGHRERGARRGRGRRPRAIGDACADRDPDADRDPCADSHSHVCSHTRSHRNTRTHGDPGAHAHAGADDPTADRGLRQPRRGEHDHRRTRLVLPGGLDHRGPPVAHDRVAHAGDGAGDRPVRVRLRRRDLLEHDRDREPGHGSGGDRDGHRRALPALPGDGRRLRRRQQRGPGLRPPVRVRAGLDPHQRRRAADPPACGDARPRGTDRCRLAPGRRHARRP